MSGSASDYGDVRDDNDFGHGVRLQSATVPQRFQQGRASGCR
jgi:hypothetical protein